MKSQFRFVALTNTEGKVQTDMKKYNSKWIVLMVAVMLVTQPGITTAAGASQATVQPAATADSSATTGSTATVQPTATACPTATASPAVTPVPTVSPTLPLMNPGTYVPVISYIKEDDEEPYYTLTWNGDINRYLNHYEVYSCTGSRNGEYTLLKTAKGTQQRLSICHGKRWKVQRDMSLREVNPKMGV